jgi:hypothetical protein
MNKWQVWGLDVWGNDIDGYEVNDRYRMFPIELTESYTDEELLQALKDFGLIQEFCTLDQLNIDGDDECLFIDDASNGQQIYQLEKMEEV